MKRKQQLSFAFFCMLLLGIFAIKFYVSRTTIEENKLERFCIKNSEIGSDDFSHFEFSEYPNYSFWVSSDEEKRHQQELFIFNKGKFFPKRMHFYFQTTSNNSHFVGNVFLPEIFGLSGDRAQPVFLYYSSNSENIAKYTLTMTENEVSHISQGEVDPSNPFLLAFSGFPDNCESICYEIAFFNVNDTPVDALTTFVSTSKTAVVDNKGN